MGSFWGVWCCVAKVLYRNIMVYARNRCAVPATIPATVLASVPVTVPAIVPATVPATVLPIVPPTASANPQYKRHGSI